jgi:hypothetical protein
MVYHQSHEQRDKESRVDEKGELTTHDTSVSLPSVLGKSSWTMTNAPISDLSYMYIDVSYAYNKYKIFESYV